MHFWAGISIENDEIIFRPFSEESFEIRNVLIKGKYYTFRQFYEDGKTKQEVIINEE